MGISWKALTRSNPSPSLVVTCTHQVVVYKVGSSGIELNVHSAQPCSSLCSAGRVYQARYTQRDSFSGNESSVGHVRLLPVIPSSPASPPPLQDHQHY